MSEQESPVPDPAEIRRLKHNAYNREYRRTEKGQRYEREYKAKHKERYNESRRKYREKQKHEIQAWLSQHPEYLKCSMPGCTVTHPAALDFHHVDPKSKEYSVSYLINNGNHPLDRIIAEIQKCVVLCANCHRIHHWNERQKASEVPSS